jgi:hypothetical protein
MTAVGAMLLLKNSSRALGQKLSGGDPHSDFPIPYQAKLDPVFYYNMATFEPYIGGSFSARGQGRDVKLTLVGVRNRSTQPTTKMATIKARPSECFSILFSAPAPLAEFTTIHQLEHGALGKFDLFLTRSEDERGQLFYEAIIHHII